MEYDHKNVKNTEGTRLLSDLHDKMSQWSIFATDNVPRIYLFAKWVEGKERIGKMKVRRGFVEINCLALMEYQGKYSGIINLNVQDEDTIWIESVLEHLFDRLDEMVFEGYAFTRQTTEIIRASPTLWFYNTRYEITK